MNLARKNLLTSVLIATSLFFTGLSYAGPLVTYDFTGGTGPSGNPLGIDVFDLGTNNITVSSDGLAVSITGKDSGAPGLSDNLDRNPVGGLGVVDNGGFARVGFDEALEFNFSPQSVLAVSSIILEVGNTNNGSLDLYVDGNFVQNIGWLLGFNQFATHSFSAVPSGLILEFQGNTGSFRVAQLTVEMVPEPSTVLLLGTGMLGLIMRTRRRNLKAK